MGNVNAVMRIMNSCGPPNWTNVLARLVTRPIAGGLEHRVVLTQTLVEG